MDRDGRISKKQRELLQSKHRIAKCLVYGHFIMAPWTDRQAGTLRRKNTEAFTHTAAVHSLTHTI